MATVNDFTRGLRAAICSRLRVELSSLRDVVQTLRDS